MHRKSHRKSTRTISVLLIGDFTSSEFQPLRASILPFCDIQAVGCCGKAVKLLQSGQYLFDLVVVAERWPGEHSHGELEELHRTAPITRMIAVSGSWCEGQKRSGKPWPGMLHTSWHNWVAHWQDDLIRLSQNRLPSFGLPVAASEHERMIVRPFPPEAEGKLIAIRSQREDMADMLASACRSQGYSAAWLDPRYPLRIEGPDAILWEGSPNQLEDLENTHQRYWQAPLLALLDFPRIDDMDQAIRLGAAEILAKPTQLEDLFARLEGVLKAEQIPETTPSVAPIRCNGLS